MGILFIILYGPGALFINFVGALDVLGYVKGFRYNVSGGVY